MVKTADLTAGPILNSLVAIAAGKYQEYLEEERSDRAIILSLIGFVKQEYQPSEDRKSVV